MAQAAWAVFLLLPAIFAAPIFPGEVLLQMPNESVDTPAAMEGDQYTPPLKMDMNAPPKHDAAVVEDLSNLIEVPMTSAELKQPIGPNYHNIVNTDGQDMMVSTASFLQFANDNGRDEMGAFDATAGMVPQMHEGMDTNADMFNKPHANSIMPEFVPHGADSDSMEPQNFLKSKHTEASAHSMTQFDMNAHTGKNNMMDAQSNSHSMGNMEMMSTAKVIEVEPVKSNQPDAMQLMSKSNATVMDLVDEQQLVEDKEDAPDGRPMPEAFGSSSLADDMERNVKITQNPDFMF